MLFFYSHLPVNVASCWIIDVLKQFIIKHFSSLLSSRLKIKHNQAIYSLQLENTDYTTGDSCARDHTYLECDLAYCLYWQLLKTLEVCDNQDITNLKLRIITLFLINYLLFHLLHIFELLNKRAQKVLPDKVHGARTLQWTATN